MNHWRVSHDESGASLVVFLKQKLSQGPSQKQIKSAIEKGACQLNGKIERFASTRVGAGDKVSFAEEMLQAASDKRGFAQDQVLYTDSVFIAYNKPAGISSEELLGCLTASFDDSLLAVHRLDKDTSGVILFAKGKENARMIEGLFRKRAVEKTYLAIVDGIVLDDAGAVRNFLGKKSVYHGQTLWGEVERSKGAFAETLWKCLQRGQTASLLSCTPKTGRTHQIRVHLSSLGHPILGDYQYGKAFKCSFRPVRQMLHAFRLVFFLPLLDKQVCIEAPVPSDFILAQEALKLSR